eukprot:2102091-Prymnesium_polylepis.1
MQKRPKTLHRPTRKASGERAGKARRECEAKSVSEQEMMRSAAQEKIAAMESALEASDWSSLLGAFVPTLDASTGDTILVKRRTTELAFDGTRFSFDV